MANWKPIWDMIAANNIAGITQYLEGGNTKAKANFRVNGVPLLGEARTPEMAELLIAKGANIHEQAYDRYTPLLSQAANIRPGPIQVILKADPSAIAAKISDNETALHLCVKNTYPDGLECVKILLENRVPIDINAKARGKTALDVLKETEDFGNKDEMIAHLVKNGALTSAEKNVKNGEKSELRIGLSHFLKTKQDSMPARKSRKAKSRKAKSRKAKSRKAKSRKAKARL